MFPYFPEIPRAGPSAQPEGVEFSGALGAPGAKVVHLSRHFSAHHWTNMVPSDKVHCHEGDLRAPAEGHHQRPQNTPNRNRWTFWFDNLSSCLSTYRSIALSFVLSVCPSVCLSTCNGRKCIQETRGEGVTLSFCSLICLKLKFSRWSITSTSTWAQGLILGYLEKCAGFTWIYWTSFVPAWKSGHKTDPGDIRLHMTSPSPGGRTLQAPGSKRSWHGRILDKKTSEIKHQESTHQDPSRIVNSINSCILDFSIFSMILLLHVASTVEHSGLKWVPSGRGAKTQRRLRASRDWSASASTASATGSI